MIDALELFLCASAHSRNKSFTLSSAPDLPPISPAKPQLRVIGVSFAGEADLGTGISNALMRRVARGELGPTMRLHRTAPILAFGRLDKLRPGYGRAVEIARAHGYEPIERMAGGRAAVFHEGTLSFSIATREQGANAGTRARFESMATTIATALASFGADARVGEVPGEYCPGEFSVNARAADQVGRYRPAGDHRWRPRGGRRGRPRSRSDPQRARTDLRRARA